MGLSFSKSSTLLSQALTRSQVSQNSSDGWYVSESRHPLPTLNPTADHFTFFYLVGAVCVASRASRTSDCSPILYVANFRTRYPAISQVIAENRIPEFDNLYVRETQNPRNPQPVLTTCSTVGYEWYHPQLHPQRLGFTHLSHD